MMEMVANRSKGMLGLIMTPFLLSVIFQKQNQTMRLMQTEMQLLQVL